jgi:hypothetical protein
VDSESLGRSVVAGVSSFCFSTLDSIVTGLMIMMLKFALKVRVRKDDNSCGLGRRTKLVGNQWMLHAWTIGSDGGSVTGAGS